MWSVAATIGRTSNVIRNSSESDAPMIRRMPLVLIGLAQAVDDEHVNHFLLPGQLQAEVADCGIERPALSNVGQEVGLCSAARIKAGHSLRHRERPEQRRRGRIELYLIRAGQAGAVVN